jgi:hypothetical protein
MFEGIPVIKNNNNVTQILQVTQYAQRSGKKVHIWLKNHENIHVWNRGNHQSYIDMGIYGVGSLHYMYIYVYIYTFKNTNGWMNMNGWMNK